mmetsp:Transcript_26838/g.55692  ORF Transcript_26838/g.55692 Transcript_26838/m.55692 type:complete len:569 (-) Transcript_26838:283-1989(-)|eukprot:CAMPEP_0172163456 /NCGR_PEP_ID=MMETSP1050-20130122/7282_1 /TAXON_ID=233186 /ORGANISM="Cryptomonas curvata, Strain CCAP979/52" /LENGTH=568 /DNA_ID=CAMNT_0012833649 /DNA_START=309 /DNA_END=2015 /DNA_ORIENTATION=-
MSSESGPALTADEVASWFDVETEKITVAHKFVKALRETDLCSNKLFAQKVWPKVCCVLRVIAKGQSDFEFVCETLDYYIEDIAKAQQLQCRTTDTAEKVKLEEFKVAINALSSSMEKMQEQTLTMYRELLSLVQATPQSPSVYGSELLDKLGKSNGNWLQDFVPSDGNPIFSHELMATLEGENEAEFIGTCFSRFQELLDEKRIVRSGYFRWLPTRGPTCHIQKPDFVVLHPAFYTRKKSPESRKEILCGVPSSRIFFQEVKPIHLTLSDPDTAFGELVIHLNHLYGCTSKYSGEPILTRGALADKTGIRLVECLMETPISVLSVKWTDQGSAKVFADFFNNSCKKREETIGYILDEVCKQLHVSIVESATAEKLCFLGAGATGKVFTVQNNHKIEYALKIVLGELDASMLKREYLILKEICGLANSARITVLAEEFCEVSLEKTIVGAGLLMSPVGTPVNRKDYNHFQLGLNSLQNLHNLRRHHGDARAANMIAVGDAVILCDLRDAFPFVADDFTDYQHDIKTFLQSFDISIDSELERCLRDYEPPSEKSVQILDSISARVRQLLQ